jgi:hypothetical protein
MAHGLLSRFNLNPAAYHHQLADRVLSYLVYTKHYALTFVRPSIDEDVEYFLASVDAAFADHPDRKSSYGYMFKLFGAAID